MIEADFRPSYPKIAPLHPCASVERAVRVFLLTMFGQITPLSLPLHAHWSVWMSSGTFERTSKPAGVDFLRPLSMVNSLTSHTPKDNSYNIMIMDIKILV